MPSRATLFTGQYPSLHGVSQTDGAAKQASDPGMGWLDPNEVPTLGDWFRAGGYQTHYRGKWHVSHADLTIPGTHEGLMASDDDGRPIPAAIDAYRKADRLDPFGFSGWIGREPHGAMKSDCGTVRDGVFAEQVVELFDDLTKASSQGPWLTVASFVNPHDIAFAGGLYEVLLGFQPDDDTVPEIPEAPSQGDSFAGRPACQEKFRDLWPQMIAELTPDLAYRRLYYYLLKVVDQAIGRILDALADSGMADDTIVVFTSDHGDLLGAHGGLVQKWGNAFDEATRVPLLVRGPGVTPVPGGVTAPTSHVDLIPTLMGLAGIDVERAAAGVAQHHAEARPLPGRDLSGLITGQGAGRLGRPAHLLHDRGRRDPRGHHDQRPHGHALRCARPTRPSSSRSSPRCPPAPTARPSSGSSTTTTSASTSGTRTTASPPTRSRRPRPSRRGSCTTSPPIPRSVTTAPATRPTS